MSHVDDGTLNAYLDGELTAVEHARVETHVAECAACRARLEETRALIQRAGQLLDLAVPPQPERAMPPLHQLRHPRPRLRFRAELAWAATIILAGAVGWYARGATDQTASPAQAPPTAFTPPAADTAVQQVAMDREPMPPTRARQNRPTPLPPPSRADSVAFAPTAAAEMDRVADRAAVPAAPAPVSQLAAGVASGAAATAEAKVTSGTAYALIPGLPVKSVRAGAGGSTIIEQQLDSATVITLVEWRSAREQGEVAAEPQRRDAAPTAAPAALRGSERLARYVGTWRVEIAGPLPVDSLSKLLERVRSPD